MSVCPPDATSMEGKGTDMPFTAKLEQGDFARPFAEWNRRADAAMRKAALIATDKASRAMLSEIRGQMAGAGLGRLGNALAATSDLKRTGRVHETSGGGWSASGGVYVRSKSERTRGAIDSYTKGAAIRPKAGRWLWIATDAVPRLSKRERLTPGMWKANGLDRKIGPLVLIKSVNGRPLLVIHNAGVSLAGARGSVKGLKKNGQARKGQVKKDLIVCFIGIPATSRAARVDVRAIARAASNELPALFGAAIERN